MTTKIITVNNEHNNIRADIFLASIIKEISRSQINNYIKKNAITLNNKPFKSSYKVQENDVFNYKNDLMEEKISIEPHYMKIDILYEDEYLAIINKPQGLLVHPTTQNKEITLLNVLMWHFPQLKEHNSSRPGIVHRLDKDTSGLMIIAKTTKSLELLAKAFKDRVIKKKYIAFAYKTPEWEELEIISGHVRHPYNRLKFFTNLEISKTNKKVRTAHSVVKLLKAYKNISKLEVTIHTGRTHQIRAHLADRGYPLLGDNLYANKSNEYCLDEELQKCVSLLKGQALVAYFLEFEHPITKQNLSFNLEMPSYLQKLDNFFV